MKNLRALAASPAPTAHGGDNYIDAFNPDDSIPDDLARIARSTIIPPLIDALQQQGFTLHVTHDLASIAAMHRSSGGRMRLIKVNDPQYHPDASPANTSGLILKRDGFPVGCVASRLRWCERTLAEEMQSGRFWVSDPESMWGRDEQCLTNAYIAKIIRACPVVYVGSVYLDPSVTGGRTLATMARLHMLWLVTHWHWSWTIGLIEGALVRRHAFDVYGVMSLEMGVWRTRPGDSALHQYHLTIIEREAAMAAWLRPEVGNLDCPLGRIPELSLRPHNPEIAAVGEEMHA
jgi:hypothetical protein